MYHTLLVPLDHSEFAEQALPTAATIARKCGAGIDVVLVHEQPALANLRRSNWNADQRREEQEYVQRIADRLGCHGVENRSHVVLDGDVVDAISTRASADNAGLIVMTSHGQTGFSRTHFGSVAYALIRNASVPVLVLRDPEIAQPMQRSGAIFKKVLVTLDGSERSERILAPALELAAQMESTVVLLRVVEPIPLYVGAELASFPMTTGILPMASQSLQDIDATMQLRTHAEQELIATKHRLNEKYAVIIETHVVVGSPVVKAIVDYASAVDADVIAMATHGRGVSRWLLGSVAEGVLKGSNFPILMSRSNGSVALSDAEALRAS